MKIYKPIVEKEGTSSVSIAEINAIGATALVTKEYADATYSGSVGNLQREVTASTVIFNEDNKFTLIFNSPTAITVTVNTLTVANFECYFLNLGAGTVTFVAGTGTLLMPDGTQLTTNRYGFLIRKLALNNYTFKIGTALATATPLANGTAAVGVSVKAAREDHVHPILNQENVWVVAFSDETTPITTGVKKVEFQMPNYATTLVDVSVSFRTAPTTSAITIDLNDGVTSVLSTKLTVDATEKTSETAAISRVISDTDLAANAVMTIDVDSADTGGTSTGGKLMLYWKKL